MTPWADEFLKIAVSVKGLAGIAGRTRTYVPGMPDIRQHGLVAGIGRRIGVARGGGAVSTPTARQAPRVLRSMDGRTQDSARKALPYLKRKGMLGTAAVHEPAKLTKVWARGTKQPRIKTPEGGQALRRVVTAHEAFERQVKPRDIMPKYLGRSGHTSMEVLMKERNLLGNLEGAGAQEAVRAVKRARAARRETKMMRDYLVKQYGPRARQFMQKGRKIPKAMRKDVLHRIRRDSRDQSRPSWMTQEMADLLEHTKPY